MKRLRERDRLWAGLECTFVRVDRIYTLAEMSVMFGGYAHLHVEGFNCIGIMLLALGMCCFHSMHWVLITFACDASTQRILWWMCFFFFLFSFLFNLLFSSFWFIIPLMKKKNSNYLANILKSSCKMLLKYNFINNY